MTIYTERPTVNRRAYQFGLDSLSSGSGVDASYDEGWAGNPITSLYRREQLDIAEKGEPTYAFRAPGPRKEPETPTLDPKTANERYGIQGQLSFDKPVREGEAKLLNQWATDRLERESILRRADKGLLSATGRVGASLLAQALDPVNIATAFIPVVGEARYASWLAKAGGAMDRAAIRAGVGAAEGAVGAAVVEPLIYSQARREQRPYDLWDSFTNVVFGGVIGGGLHVAGGAVADRFSRPPTAGERLVQDIGADTHAAALRGAVAALAEDRPVRVAEALGATRSRFMTGTSIGTVSGERFSPTPPPSPKAPQRSDITLPEVDKSGKIKLFDTEQQAKKAAKNASKRGEQLVPERQDDGSYRLVSPAQIEVLDDFVEERAAVNAMKRIPPSERTQVHVVPLLQPDGSIRHAVVRGLTDRQASAIAANPYALNDALMKSPLQDAPRPTVRPEQAINADREIAAVSDEIVNRPAKRFSVVDLHEDDGTLARAQAIDEITSPRIERDEDIATQMQEAEQSLAEIQSLIREGDEVELKAADEIVSQANREAKAYEIMASCSIRRPA